MSSQQDEKGRKERRRDFSEEQLMGHLVTHFLNDEERDMKTFLADCEKSLITSTLKRTLGSQRATAEILGVKPTTLNEKIKRFRIKIKKSIIL